MLSYRLSIPEPNAGAAGMVPGVGCRVLAVRNKLWVVEGKAGSRLITPGFPDARHPDTRYPSSTPGALAKEVILNS